ncbi:MAG: UbiA family prenyltransferase, partial [Candidatus Altiarchaeota archaeon]|nr:UbiA family prenyltransferase [Candidatus Altiarchaeota archaeon]
MTSFSQYLCLYRYDVALITFFSYLLGATISGSSMTESLILGFLVSMVSMNFVYSLNSWSDQSVDAVNKPFRPLPSNKLSAANAFNYSLALLMLSLIYPLFYVETISQYLHFLILPLLGILYSVEPIRLKKRLYMAVPTAAIILLNPIFLGYIGKKYAISDTLFLIPLVFYALSVLPLKDIEDIKGDKKFKCGNWCEKLGPGRLLSASATLLTLT